MKLLLFGKNAQNLTSLAKSLGFELVEENPEVILSYGGDGTLLASEQKFPGIPKLPIRDSQVCQKCSAHADEALLTKLKNNELTLTTYEKLEARFLEDQVVALNDIVIRNALPTHAVRLTVQKNDQPASSVIIGDGIVASTTFGSTGYFQSISRKTFEQGFGLAFNNPVKKTPPLFFTDQDIIRVEIVRGPATLSFDNSQQIYQLKEKDSVEIKASQQKALIYSPQTLRCPDCQTKS